MKSLIEAWESAPMEIEGANGKGIVYCFQVNGLDNWAYVYKTPEKDEYPIVRIQSQCIMGIELGDVECDCKQNLINSTQYIKEQPNGGIIFILNDDGKNLGGIKKLQQVKARYQGISIKTAVELTGGVFDARTYEFIPEAMKIMGFTSKFKLITRYPSRVQDLTRDGVTIVEAIPYDYFITSGNQSYMYNKKNEYNYQFFDPTICQSSK